MDRRINKGKPSDLSVPIGKICKENLNLLSDKRRCGSSTSSIGFGSRTSKISSGVYSMLPSARERKENKRTFLKNYNYLCHLNNSPPRVKVKPGNELDFYGDRIRFEDWSPITQAIATDETLKSIKIKSYNLVSPGSIKNPAINKIKMLSDLVSALKKSISISKSLTSLELQSLPLTVNHINLLTQAIKLNTSLQHLALPHCSIGDKGSEILCNTLRYHPLIVSLDLSECAITQKGANFIAQMIQIQRMARYGEYWEESLRYRKPNPSTSSVGGLKRITLDGNVQLEDAGFAVIMSSLVDDLWIKEISCRNCSLTNVGAEKAVDVVRNNKNIKAIDIRRNLEVDPDYVKLIENIIRSNSSDFPRPSTSLELKNYTSQESIVRQLPYSARRNDAWCCCCSCPSHSHPSHSQPVWPVSSSPERRYPPSPAVCIPRLTVAQAQRLKGSADPSGLATNTFGSNGSHDLVNEMKDLSELERTRRALHEKIERLDLEIAHRLAAEERCKFLEEQVKSQQNCVLVEKEVLENMISTFQQFTCLFNNARKAGLDEFLKSKVRRIRRRGGGRVKGSADTGSGSDGLYAAKGVASETVSDTNAVAIPDDEAASVENNRISSLSDDNEQPSLDQSKRARALFIKLLKESNSDIKKTAKHQI